MNSMNEQTADYSQYTILIVDDVPVNLMIVEKMLTNYHFNILKADNGLKALEIVADRCPDLILLDIMMPGIDGYETLKRLREDKNIPRIPVIMMSALNSESDIKKAISLGANDFLRKPVIKEQLENSIKNQLKPVAAQGRNRTDVADSKAPADLNAMFRFYQFCSKREAVQRLMTQVALLLPTSWMDEGFFDLFGEADSDVLKGKIRAWAAGKINGAELNAESVDMSAVILRIQGDARPLMAERNLSLEMTGNSHVQIKTDSVLCESILRGLLACVCRTCSDGTVTLNTETTGNSSLVIQIVGSGRIVYESDMEFCQMLTTELVAKAGGSLTMLSDAGKVTYRLALYGMA